MRVVSRRAVAAVLLAAVLSGCGVRAQDQPEILPSLPPPPTVTPSATERPSPADSSTSSPAPATPRPSG